MKVSYWFIVLLFVGCSSKDANHLPSLWELPGAVIGSAVENSVYAHKRSNVKQYIITHYDVLRQEVKAGDGVHLNAVLNKANIRTSSIATVKKSLQKEHATMFKNTLLSTEAVMQAFGALYLSKEKTKTMNGFTYTQASNMVQAHLKKHFEAFRLSLKHKTITGLAPLTHKLKMKNPNKRNAFYASLWKRYDALIIEPVVVGFMVRGN